MLTARFSELRKSERVYSDILKQVRQIESKNRPTTTSSITGRTITLAALSTKFTIRPRATSEI